MHFQQPEIYFFSANLILIFAYLFSAILFITLPLKIDPERARTYLPIRQSILCGFCLIFLQFPYLFYINAPESFLFVQVSELIFYLPIVHAVCERIYLTHNPHIGKERNPLYELLILMAAAGALIYLEMGGNLLENEMEIRFVAFLFMLMTFFYLFIPIVRVYKKEQRYHKLENSCEFSLPESRTLNLARIHLFKIGVLTISFLMADPWFKLTKDLFFAIVTLGGVIEMTHSIRLRNHVSAFRTSISESPISTFMPVPDPILEPESLVEPEYDKEDKGRLETLYDEILAVIEEKELYKVPDLKLNDLLQYLPTNRTYLSAAINSRGEMNFYRLIQGYRLRCAIQLLEKDPALKISDIASEAGFSSPKIFARIFRQEMEMTPSEYRKQNTIRGLDS